MPSNVVDSDSLDQCYRDLFGYLNFSDGSPTPRFRSCVNTLFAQPNFVADPEDLVRNWQVRLKEVTASDGEVFRDTTQAERAIEFALLSTLPAYVQHQRDLLFHIDVDQLQQSFFYCRLFESTLASAAEVGWQDAQSVATLAVDRLNSYVGYRPVAVLENDRRAEVYLHERFCPIPLFFKETGVATGRFQALIESTLSFIQDLPDDMTLPAHFDLDRLEELCLDIRAHDHLHPVNKRTNYMFGEWDPETINVKGFYTRFVVRLIILESLQRWIDGSDQIPYSERLFDASAVLAGTILMASSISGSGPSTYDSTVSLTSLLPIVARQRDQFYQSLMNSAVGERRQRLVRSAEESRQPFGHVRHQLNMYLSQYGALQVQHRHLATLYASMGFDQAACEEAQVIPCASARFESEIQARLVLVRKHLRTDDAASALQLLKEGVDLLQRGIRCGAVVDPWNVLGFQGMFPLFVAREDSIPDNRVEVLIEIMDYLFDASAAVMAQAAATGDRQTQLAAETLFAGLAEEWDDYATTTVNDIPSVNGQESLKAARQVATALAEWRTAGEASGDISFWRNHVTEFESCRSFAQVVSALLERNDDVAAMGLLMQWLSQAEDMGLESGNHSMHHLMHRLLATITAIEDPEQQWTTLRRLFAFIEANGGEFWSVPSLAEFVDRHRNDRSDQNDDELDLDHLFDEEDDDNEQNLFQAAYEDVVFRDSADDGNESDTLDDGYAPGTTEFEIIYRRIEPRLKFLHTVGSLWSSAAMTLSRQADTVADARDQQDHIREWLKSIRHFLKEMGRLIQEIHTHEIQTYSADLDANIEYDIQMQSRFLLMQNAISTTVEFLMAERMLCSVLLDGENLPGQGREFDKRLVEILRAVLCNDVEKVRELFSGFTKALQKRPLLYVPFEQGGQPTGILKARTLQAVIRLLLSQLPRLGMLEETFRLLQVAYRMERTARPLGQAVTEFDRLFNIGLSCSVEALLHAASRWKMETLRQRRSAFRRIQSLLDVFNELWVIHSGSMRLSIVEDLHDESRCEEVQDFIAKYGDDLFHTRMLTLGNARAIVHHGADSLLEELEASLDTHRPVAIIEDIHDGILDRELAADLMEFIYEAVVDNFDRFLEYNTTTTHSDYGNRLFCLLDFLRLESLYERFNWNHTPYQIAHEVAARFGNDDMAAELERELREETRNVAESLVEELRDLESEYGVQLPTLHDHICDRIVGKLAVNRMTARISRCSSEPTDITEAEAKQNFQILRDEIADYMEDRLGSGIEPPDWMQELAREFERASDRRVGHFSELLLNVDFQRVTQREIDRQISNLQNSD